MQCSNIVTLTLAYLNYVMCMLRSAAAASVGDAAVGGATAAAMTAEAAGCGDQVEANRGS